jgi:Tfp pilus assembly protein PilF
LVFLGHADSIILTDTDMRRSEVDHAFVFARSDKPSASMKLDMATRALMPLLTPSAPKIQPDVSVAKSVSARAATTPKPVPAPMMSLLTKAQIAADCGNLAEAEKALLAHLAVEPSEIQAHVLFGCVQMAQKKFPEAERSFTKVVYLDPVNSLSLLSLAAIADMRGDAKSAERFRDRAARTVMEKRH